MNGYFRLACLAGAVCIISACSTMTVQQANATAAASKPASATAPAAPAAATAPAATSGAKATPIVLNDSTLTEDEVKQILAAKYKPVTKNGQIIYCRTEQILGSRFPQRVCGSGQEILAQTKAAQEQTDLRQRTNSIMHGN